MVYGRDGFMFLSSRVKFNDVRLFLSFVSPEDKDGKNLMGACVFVLVCLIDDPVVVEDPNFVIATFLFQTDSARCIYL